ncbi:TIGR02206 family membrane protein [Cytobacillus sp. FJAT-54145]|uniref:TIGR02206 family membrane protein n=1 Tax=Cytobacillus spartinae TaxID=3299023 RepID=A0ABW6K918_9BACI
MKELFGHNYELYPFEIFSVLHVLTIGVFLAVSFIMYLLRERLRMYDKKIRIVMFLSLFLFELAYHYWLFKDGYWDVSFTLPLQLCSISLLLCLVLLATNLRWMFQIVFFLGGAGALQALITPELFVGFPHFRFIQFFITHMLIIWVALYYLFVKGYRPTSKGLLHAFLFLNAAAVFAFIANIITGGNYMFLARKPTNASLLDYLGPYPTYILSLEVIAISLFVIMYLPFGLGERKKKRSVQ